MAHASALAHAAVLKLTDNEPHGAAQGVTGAGVPSDAMACVQNVSIATGDSMVSRSGLWPHSVVVVPTPS